jgi:dihydroneopterin aldolase
MDTINIEDLEIFYCVGVTEEERAKPQRLLLNIQLTLDLTTAAVKDDLRWTVDYMAVCERLRTYGERRSWSLIETVCLELTDMLQREFAVPAVVVEVKKFVVPNARWVAVRSSRPV